MTTPTFERVRDLASDVFGVAPQSLTTDSSPETVEAWDSTHHLNFILALEETFQLQLSPEETASIRRLGDAIDLIEAKVRATAE